MAATAFRTVATRMVLRGDRSLIEGIGQIGIDWRCDLDDSRSPIEYGRTGTVPRSTAERAIWAGDKRSRPA